MANLQYYGYAPRIYYGGTMTCTDGDNTYNVGTTIAGYLVANESMLIWEFDRTYGNYGCFLITAVNAGTGDITISPTPTGTVSSAVYYYTRADANFEYAWARSLGEVLKFRRYVDVTTDQVPVPGDGDDYTAVYDFDGNIMKIDMEGFYNVSGGYDYCTDSTDNWDRLPQFYIPKYSMDSQQCERPAAFLWHNSERKNNGAQGHPVIIEKFSYKFAAGRCTSSRTIIDYRLTAIVRNTEIC